MVPDRYHLRHQRFCVASNDVDRWEQDVLRELIVRWRAEAGLSQRELSAKLRRPHNYIVKLETGSRGLEVVELIDIIRALGKDVPTAFSQIASEMDR